MFNNVYQEYINNIFGRNIKFNRMEISNFENNMNNNNFFQNTETLYPDIYKLLYPMIQYACMKNSNPLSENTINAIVDEIYLNFVADPNNGEVLDDNIDYRSGKNIDATVTAKTKSSISVNSKRFEAVEKRQQKEENYILRDLIKILVVRELLGMPVRNEPQFRPAFGY